MKIAVYLAAPYGARDAIRSYASELAAVNIECTSSWLDEQDKIGAGTVGAATDIDDQSAALRVRKDFRDIGKAHILVLFTESAAKALTVGGSSTSGGRHVETGYALASGKRVIVVGTPENIFHRGAECTIVPDWHEALIELIRTREQWRAEQPQAVDQ